MERKLARQKPWPQQHIVAEALTERCLTQSRRWDWKPLSSKSVKTGYFILAPCLKLQHLDGFVAFINPVINQVVLVNQF